MGHYEYFKKVSIEMAEQFNLIMKEIIKLKDSLDYDNDRCYYLCSSLDSALLESQVFMLKSTSESYFLSRVEIVLKRLDDIKNISDEYGISEKLLEKYKDQLHALKIMLTMSGE